MKDLNPQRFAVIRMTDLPPADCPCGRSRRAFVDDPDQIASLHLVDIKTDARPHYHKQTTEIYYILEGAGEMELDGVRRPIEAGDAILIKPGCRHRAIGSLRLINVPIPAFDPTDEWFD